MMSFQGCMYRYYSESSLMIYSCGYTDFETLQLTWHNFKQLVETWSGVKSNIFYVLLNKMFINYSNQRNCFWKDVEKINLK